ncbi:MAG: S24/S26 family peptidase [Nitrospiraceae bacterium]|nr:S24/S26 family peptidase [Nitrospiraceae bacterium]
MIQLLPPSTLDDRFVAQDLPDSLQLPLLGSMVAPRIVSSSMAPTIQAGDRLELSPPTCFTIGTIVVFRVDTLLVCHRITAIDPEGVLSTRGDATQGPCEIVQPSAVIGTVAGVTRGDTYLPLGQSPSMLSTPSEPFSRKSRIRTLIVWSVTQSIRVLARFSFFQHMLVILLRWTATVDVLTEAPLRSLPSHSKVASFRLRMSPHITELFAACNKQQPAQYSVRLGPWRLAQYDPVTESLLLRQSLREAGLEPFIRQIFAAR